MKMRAKKRRNMNKMLRCDSGGYCFIFHKIDPEIPLEQLCSCMSKSGFEVEVGRLAQIRIISSVQ